MASGTGPMKKKKKEPYFANTDAHKKKVSKGRGKTARVADAKYKAKRVVEKLNPFDKESKARRAERRAKRAVAKHSKRRTKIAAKLLKLVALEVKRVLSGMADLIVVLRNNAEIWVSI